MKPTTLKKLALLLLLSSGAAFGQGYQSGGGASASNSSTPAVVAICYQHTTQAFADSAYTIINYDTCPVDTASAVTTGAAWKFTVPTTGYYLIGLSASLFLNGGSTTDYLLKINVNSVFRYPMWRAGVRTSSVGNGSGIWGSAIYSLTAGDIVQPALYQLSGASRNMDTADLYAITISQVR
jgi:hypothetical protein